jgi:hypothetical protein
MIVLADRPGGSQQDAGTRVVYHTGHDASQTAPEDAVVARSQVPGAAGEVRLVSIEELLAHPDPAWHPLPHNPRFLGVHRLAIAEHTVKSPAHLGRRPSLERSSP